MQWIARRTALAQNANGPRWREALTERTRTRTGERRTKTMRPQARGWTVEGDGPRRRSWTTIVGTALLAFAAAALQRSGRAGLEAMV